MNHNLSTSTQHPHCSRREFLQAGSATALALALPLGTSAAAPISTRTGSCQSLIVIWLQGGLSHLDSFDPKPEAPVEIRGKFNSIATRVPGLRFTEPLRGLAAIAHKLTVIRSMHHPDNRHEPALTRMFGGTGTNSILTERLGGSSARLGYFGLEQLSTPNQQTHTALNLPQEPVKQREAYGQNRFGENCLSARRLIESGVRLVNITDAGWDHHYRAADSLEYRLPVLDQAVSALIRDLDQRGLLETTMVLGLTEFGRSPKINPDAGREHWPHAFSVFAAGGGLPAGQVIGSTTAHGTEPDSSPVSPEELFQTVCHQISEPAHPTLMTEQA